MGHAEAEKARSCAIILEHDLTPEADRPAAKATRAQASRQN